MERSALEREEALAARLEAKHAQEVRCAGGGGGCGGGERRPSTRERCAAPGGEVVVAVERRGGNKKCAPCSLHFSLFSDSTSFLVPVTLQRPHFFLMPAPSPPAAPPSFVPQFSTSVGGGHTARGGRARGPGAAAGRARDGGLRGGGGRGRGAAPQGGVAWWLRSYHDARAPMHPQQRPMGPRCVKVTWWFPDH